MSREYLSTYLNDHLAGSVTAMELLERLMDETPDLHVILAQLRADVQADQQKLVDLMSRLQIPQSRLRKAGGWFAEKFAEAKLEVDDQSDGLLRRLERLEALVLGIDGKLVLWKALNAAASVDTRLRELDYIGLAQRAREQRERVEVLRIEAARSALPVQKEVA
jgi:hypothetical protein